MRLPIILSIITIAVIVIIVCCNKKAGNKPSGASGKKTSDNEGTIEFVPDPDNPLFGKEENKEKKRDK